MAELEANQGVLFSRYIVKVSYHPPQVALEKWGRNTNETQDLLKRQKTMGRNDRTQWLFCKVKVNQTHLTPDTRNGKQ